MPADSSGRRRRTVHALVATGAVVALYLLAVRTTVGRSADEHVWAIVAGWAGEPGTSLVASTAGAARLALPVLLAAVVMVLACRAIVLRRWRALWAAGVLACGSVTLSLVLRDAALGRPVAATDGVYDHNTFPSTHVTAAAALCMAALWLWPTTRPPLLVVRAGLVVAGLAALASVASHAHRPSDAVGSLLLVAALAPLVAGAARLPASVPVLDRPPRPRT